MTVKSGADISNLHSTLKSALHNLDNLWPALFPEDKDGLNVTSGHEGDPTDGVHSFKSKHYTGNAVDLRLNDVRQAKATIVAGIIWQVLTLNFGDKFILFTEALLTPNSHLHIELK